MSAWYAMSPLYIKDALERGWREPPRRYPGHELLDGLRAVSKSLRRQLYGVGVPGGNLRHFTYAGGRSAPVEIFYIQPLKESTDE